MLTLNGGAGLFPSRASKRSRDCEGAVVMTRNPETQSNANNQTNAIRYSRRNRTNVTP